MLDLDGLAAGDTLAPLLNSPHGTVTQIGAMRNALSDAHGRGQLSPHVSEAMAELPLNSAATVATFAIRHYKGRAKDATA